LLTANREAPLVAVVSCGHSMASTKHGLGARIPDHMKPLCCWSAPEKPFLTADCNEATRDMLSGLQPL
jgi:hypothetical protein